MSGDRTVGSKSPDGPNRVRAAIEVKPDESHLPASGAAHRAKRFIASAGGVGFAPVFPGTLASVGAAGVYVAIALLTPGWWIVVPFAILLGGVGVWLGNQALELFGSEDPRAFVLDEVVGMWVAMFGMGDSLPVTWYGVLAAIVLFRLFDIVKPYPVGRIDRIHNGWGIMGDDVAAGLCAGILVRIGWMVWALVA